MKASWWRRRHFGFLVTKNASMEQTQNVSNTTQKPRLNTEKEDKSTINMKEETTTIPWPWIKAVNDIIIDEPYEEPENMPVEILPWLFLGAQFDLRAATLLELGITHVLTTNKQFSQEELEKLKSRFTKIGIQHEAVPGLDEPGYEMMENHWPVCREFLSQVRNGAESNNYKVVVHCAAGQNRSGLMVAAALIELERMLLLDAVKLLKEKRGMVLINLSFQRQACMLAAEQGLLGEKPDGYTDDPVPERNYKWSNDDENDDRW